MAEQVLMRGAGRFFRRLGPRAQVALCELPLTLIVGGVVIAAPAIWPSVLQNPMFISGIILHGILFLCCLLIPWERLAPHYTMVIPILDLFGIFLTRNGAYPIIPGLSLLAIFPVIWLAASGMLARTGLILSLLGPFLISLPPFIAHLPNPTGSDISGILLLPLMMFAVALSIRFASASARLQQRRVKQRDVALRQLLTASRERERLLKTILDATDVGIVAVDPNGKIIRTNNQHKIYQQMAGSEESSVDGDRELMVFSPDRKSPLPPEKRPIRRAIRGETFADYLVWIASGHEQRALSTAARSMTDDDGRFSGAVVVYSDITNVVEALTAKDELVSNVSHEFGSPLTSILGNLDLVLNGSENLSPETLRHLEVAMRNAERLRALVSDLLLSAAAVESVHPRRTDMAGLVQNSMVSAQAQAEAANVDLVADVPAPLWANADPLRIGQALDNLVSNAIKYSPGGGVVKVSARRTDGWVRLEVADTGMGMTPEESSRIFTRFFRTTAAREAAIPGVGLGLSITRNIVERHGGTIACSSLPGKGSTFTLTLPVDGENGES
ncbi:cell wall metabolism sensor histidine kinase WalK [Arthrobacter sp. ISL-30]|uniref:sensor histidine kinase n=1 Tax=Arthrobacter sp. ISL-30 TaxID=2819109 RepID=UPI001BEBE671|nr:PAS domain-containing sensor histidine kinase [Arthrobacter sp. ISL-30]MBT2514393.1 PAS domain-containing protein [Arthrobacter sp. ISL-30]